MVFGCFALGATLNIFVMMVASRVVGRGARMVGAAFKKALGEKPGVVMKRGPHVVWFPCLVPYLAAHLREFKLFRGDFQVTLSSTVLWTCFRGPIRVTPEMMVGIQVGLWNVRRKRIGDGADDVEFCGVKRETHLLAMWLARTFYPQATSWTDADVGTDVGADEVLVVPEDVGYEDLARNVAGAECVVSDSRFSMTVWGELPDEAALVVGLKGLVSRSAAGMGRWSREEDEDRYGGWERVIHWRGEEREHVEGCEDSEEVGEGGRKTGRKTGQGKGRGSGSLGSRVWAGLGCLGRFVERALTTHNLVHM